MKTLAPLLRSLALVLFGACAAPRAIGPPADLVLLHGRIETVDPALGEVEALACRDGRIVAVGANADVLPLVGPDTKVIELEGRRAIPGFIEGHGHFTGIGEALQILNLNDVENWDEVVAMVKEAAESVAPGEWIMGRGWHQEKWDRVPADAVEGFPSHAALSAVSPDNPVCLRHASGHACFFNAKAMEIAGVDGGTPNPPGGDILHDADGNPTGLFNETAMRLVGRFEQQRERTPEEEREALERSIRLADAECLSKGVTSFQDAGSSFETARVMREMAEAGEVGTRLWVMIRDSNDDMARELADARVIGAGDHKFTLRAVKRSIDGALGSRGAWLLEDYSDAPGNRGLNTASIESVTETARLAAEHDYQLCVHAIGDRANREVLDLMEQMLEANGGVDADHRWRIEHAQHVNPADIPRFAELGVIASMQAVHCTSDGPWVPTRLGDERSEEGAYVWRKFMDAGVLVTNGTDAPVEDVDPLDSFYASVTRRTKDGSVFYGDQVMTRMEALASYTINCAKAAFEEDEKGTLTPGKLADVVVLSKDILTVPEEEIRDAKVDLTIVGGDVLYERE